MNKPVIIAFCVGLIGGALAVSQLQSRDIYELRNNGNLTLKINKQTGQTWIFAGSTWVPVQNPN